MIILILPVCWSSTYTNMYKAIEYANVCIKNLPEMNVSDGEKKKSGCTTGRSFGDKGLCILEHSSFLW